MMNALKNIVRFCRTTLAGKDDGEYPIQQVEFLGKVGEALVWMPYGIHANIPPEYLGVLLTHQGNRESRTMFPGSPQDRERNLPEGELIFYHPPTGSKIHFKADGSIDLVTDVNLNATVGGNVILDVEGTITVNSDNSIVLDCEAAIVASSVTQTQFQSNTSVIMLAPQIVIGVSGGDNIVDLMSEMCQLVHDSQVDHSGSQPMNAATKALWVALKARVDVLS